MKIIAASAVLMLACFGCNPNKTDAKQSEATEKLVSEADRQVGMPNITNFQERKILKRIYEMRDQENIVMFAYTQAMDGQLVYLGKCMGYGVPYGAQYTNPSKFASNGGSTWMLMPQAEPNGVFSPHTADATWLLLIDEEGKTHPAFIETRIVVSPIKIATAKGNP